jgi:hypothetical protein
MSFPAHFCRFMLGGTCAKKVRKDRRGEIDRCDPVHTSMGETAVLKGAVRGGLEKDLSPLKTRSVRKLGKDKEKCVCSSISMPDGPRALRAQKPWLKLENDCGNLEC